MALYDDPYRPRTRPVGGGGGSASAPPGATATQPQGATSSAPAGAQQQAQRQPGTGFVGFDRYFQANRQGAQQMADRIAGGVQQQGQAAQGAMQGAQDAFAQRTQQATLTHSPRQPNTYAEAVALAGTEYKGPKTWEEAGVNVGEVTEQVGQAQAQANSLATAGGRAALLRESYRSGPSTVGGSALDAALAGQAGGARFAQLHGMYGGIGQQLQEARGGTEAAYSAAKEATGRAADQYEAELGQWQTPHVRPIPAIPPPKKLRDIYDTGRAARPGPSGGRHAPGRAPDQGPLLGGRR
jgi:hypothetical protein